MQVNKNDLKQFIAQDRTDEVIDILLKKIDLYLSENKEDKQVAKINEALLINSGRLKSLIHEKNLGILSSEELRISKIEVQRAVLYVIEQLPDCVFDLDKLVKIEAMEQRTLEEYIQQKKESEAQERFEKERQLALEKARKEKEEKDRNAVEELEQKNKEKEEREKQEKQKQLTAEKAHRKIGDKENKILDENKQKELQNEDAKIRIDLQKITIGDKSVQKDKQLTKNNLEKDNIGSSKSKYLVFGIVGIFVIVFFIWKPWKSNEDFNYEQDSIIPGSSSSEDEKLSVDNTDNMSFTDNRDGQIYKTIKIGDQVWMAENLAFKAGEGCWYPSNDQSLVGDYGYLYDWETAKKSCPTGWHLPTKKEFEKLLENFGALEEKAYQELCYNGTSGFSARFSGSRTADGKFVYYIKGAAGYWSSTPNDEENAWYFFIGGNSKAHLNYDNPSSGFSVRCIQDN